MKRINVEPYIRGAVSLEMREEGIKPWRIPHEERDLFPPNAINGKAEQAAGVRISFVSDTSNVTIGMAAAEAERPFDCVVDGKLVSTQIAAPSDEQIAFAGLPAGKKRIDIYLPQTHSVILTYLEIDSQATAEPVEEKDKLRWIAYGSSITQCAEAESPAQTWPALVARRNDWNLTCLGFAANCHMETMVARMIRDLPADFISLCLGINVMGGASYSLRTFRAQVIGFVKTIREAHHSIPILLQSPIFSPEREVTPNKVELTLPDYRKELYEAYKTLRSQGDQHLYYLDGLDVFDEKYAHLLPDNLHPNAEGYRVMADHFDRAVRQTIPQLFENRK